MLSLFSILKCSGGHWCRWTLAWGLFVIVVHGLAMTGSEGADAERAAYNAAVTQGAFGQGGQTRPLPGKVQVAVVSVSTFDPAAFDAEQFFDNDDLPPAP
ncbi:MAG: hypothetical protein ACM3L9_05630 [Deltaproteobacteria bacterium]